MLSSTEKRNRFNKHQSLAMGFFSSFIDSLNNIFPISDETYSYAEELQFQEALEASLNMSTTSEASSRYTSSLSSQICCEICTEDKEKQEMFEIEGCPHSFCLICISKHVESKLQDNIIFISCPGENCKSIIEPSLLKSIVPKNIIARWEEALSESTILDSQKYYCPFKDCSEILLNDNDEGIVIRESECPRCRRLFCAQCNVPWHTGLDCKNFRRSNQDKREQEKLRLLAKEKKWKECPNCKVFVDKTEGCIHITCRCKFEFCYICGSNWNDTHFTTCQR